MFIWTSDLQNAEEHIPWFIRRAGSYSLGSYLAVGRGFKGQLAILNGGAKGGVENLQSCLEELHNVPCELVTTLFDISLVQGLAAIGQYEEGATLINECIERVEVKGDWCYMPELLLTKGASSSRCHSPWWTT